MLVEVLKMLVKENVLEKHISKSSIIKKRDINVNNIIEKEKCQ